MDTPTLADLQAMIAALSAQQTEPETPTAPIPTAKQFSSMGYVAVGDGTDPGEGAVIQVPTKAGKIARVRTLHKVDTSNLQGEFGAWAYTFKRLKRGEQ